jgi:nicotinate-nucleotide--dimethylbenzimidazole phosphoribosyltransferase
MADDEIRDKEAADDLDPAFDSIDATMKNVPPKEVTVTPEALAQIVNEAVAKAISAYEQSRGGTPDAAATPGDPAASTRAWRAKIEQLKGDMGIDEIEFEGPPPEPVEAIVHRELSSQMGVHDFEFEDAPGLAAEPDAPTRTEADAVAGWALTPQHAAPPAAPEVEETPAPAAADEKAGDAEPRFDWIAAEMERLESEPLAAPPEPEVKPAPSQAPEPVARAIPEPVVRAIPEPVASVIPETVNPPIEEPPATSKPEVRETLGSLASWFRSVLGDGPQEREPAAAAAVPEPEAPNVPASPPAPEPPGAVPPPVVARSERPLKPSRDPADTISFTFDPIPPVPPRLPREPKEPPKVKKSGTFL